MKVLSHGPGDYDEAPRDWLIYEGNGVQLRDGDWAAIADVGVTLLSDLHQWVRTHGAEEFWQRLVENLAWLPERVQPHDQEGAHRLRAACLGADYRRRYSRLVGRVGERIFKDSDHVDAFRRNGCRITNGHRSPLNFSNLTDVQDVDIVAYEPDTMAIRAICEVKTLADHGRRSFEANGACADVMRRASEQGVFIALGVVRLRAPVPYSILEPGGAKRYLEHLRAHPDQYSIEYYPPGNFQLVGLRFVIEGDQLALSF